jgi:hypothetical protein
VKVGSGFVTPETKTEWPIVCSQRVFSAFRTKRLGVHLKWRKQKGTKRPFFPPKNLKTTNLGRRHPLFRKQKRGGHRNLSTEAPPPRDWIPNTSLGVWKMSTSKSDGSYFVFCFFLFFFFFLNNSQPSLISLCVISPPNTHIKSSWFIRIPKTQNSPYEICLRNALDLFYYSEHIFFSRYQIFCIYNSNADLGMAVMVIHL